MSKLESRIKKIEKSLPVKSDIDRPKYYELENGKYIVFEAGLKGVREIIDYVITGDYTESPLTLEQILEQYPNIINDTESINITKAKPLFT